MNKTDKKINSFTLVETVITLGVLGIILASSIIGFKSTKSSVALKDAQANIYNALVITRNRAANGAGAAQNQGIQIQVDEGGKKYVVMFEESDCTGEIRKIELPPVDITPSDDCITFSRLAAASSDNTITISNAAGTQVITITKDGLIITQ